MKEKRKIKTICNIIIYIFVCESFLLFFAIFIRGQNSYSELENRDLQKYDNISLSKFSKGEYQNKLELFLTDQLLYSGKIKQTYNEMNAVVNNLFIDKFTEPIIVEPIQKNEGDDIIVEPPKVQYKYIKIKSDVYKFVKGENFFDKYRKSDSYVAKVKKGINKMNKALDEVSIPKYLYYVSSSRSVDLTVEDGELHYDLIKEKLNVDYSDKLDIMNYDEYKEYFYKTDHHWNHKGQYKGYTEIQQLLGNIDIIEPVKEVTYKVDYFGSYARTTLDYSSPEKFTVYKYKFKKYTTTLNGVRRAYGDPKSYDNKTYSTYKLENRYRSYYGGDFGEIVYDFNQPKKENLLIIATSYSNSINNLIASSYDKTYIIDLRHVYGHFNFNVKDYVKKNKIDKILIIGDVYFFSNPDNWIRG